MSLPNNERERVIVGPTEPIASTVINRGLSRLFQNDEYLEGYIGKVGSSADDTPYYLSDKIIQGPGISITEDVTVNGTALRITATTSGTVPSAGFSGVVSTGSIVDEDIAVFDGISGDYIKSGLALSGLTSHLADTNNPHQTALSGLDGMNLSGATEGDGIIFSGGNWVNTPFPSGSNDSGAPTFSGAYASNLMSFSVVLGSKFDPFYITSGTTVALFEDNFDITNSLMGINWTTGLANIDSYLTIPITFDPTAKSTILKCRFSTIDGYFTYYATPPIKFYIKYESTICIDWVNNRVNGGISIVDRGQENYPRAILNFGIFNGATNTTLTLTQNGYPYNTTIIGDNVKIQTGNRSIIKLPIYAAGVNHRYEITTYL